MTFSIFVIEIALIFLAYRIKRTLNLKLIEIYIDISA